MRRAALSGRFASHRVAANGFRSSRGQSITAQARRDNIAPPSAVPAAIASCGASFFRIIGRRAISSFRTNIAIRRATHSPDLR
ncbi:MULTISPECIES: hypothetical protein [unclassified Burkholderia]|uniref:hypothetical protein n=1 Tax=unclassified Burkholderia TaxID=2613784 RepID=UPI000A7856F8|nr:MULTISPECIES: hypothetical protein [unclassified Burkholderia]